MFTMSKLECFLSLFLINYAEFVSFSVFIVNMFLEKIFSIWID